MSCTNRNRTETANIKEYSFAERPLAECALAISGDERVLEQIKEMLEMNDSSVITCPDMVQAIDLFRREGPTLIIADMGTCEPQHLELIHTVKRTDESVPVILLAATTDLEIAIMGVEEGAYDYIEKPIMPRLFRIAIRRACQFRAFMHFKLAHKRLLEEEVEEKTLEVVRRKDFLRGILDSSTLVSVVLTDLDQNVLFWNKGAENVFGYTSEEMMGQKITRLYPPDETTKETVERLQRLVRTKTGAVHGKMRQVAKSGRMLTISLAISPMLDGQGNVRGILGVGQDVTEETRLNEELLESLQLIKQTQDASIFSLAKLAESRDEETGLHLSRIQHYCRVLCMELCKRRKYRNVLTPARIDDLVRSSVLHDIGKVGLPDSILLCPDRFGPEQYEIMKQHPIYGGRALEDAVNKLGAESFLSMGRDIAYYHHERWDGTGYPFGRKGDEIPLSARIVAVVDVYDALTTQRRYKSPFNHDEACAVIIDEKGKQFDPELVAVFLEVETEFNNIRNRLSAGDLAY
jgi:PAS domain S-box-containing protein